MKLYRIRNKYMYKSTKKNYDPNGNHIYAVYYDKKTGRHRAIQLTHLYEEKKVYQIDHGYINVEKFKNLKHPSGVRKQYYDSDVNGVALDFGKNSPHQYIGKVPFLQSKRILAFVNKKSTKKRKHP